MEPQEGQEHNLSEVQQRIDQYQLALRDAGYTAGTARPLRSSSSRSRPLTNTHEAFEMFARMNAAPTVLAMIGLYAEQAGLRERSDFAVSCLPGSFRTRDEARATTVSVGMVEVLVVLIHPATQAVSKVVVYFEPDEDLNWLDAWPEAAWWESDLDGGGLGVEVPANVALRLMSDPLVAAGLARRVAGIRRRRRRTRTERWHNRWLWALADRAVASPPLSAESFASVTDVSAPDAQRSPCL